MPAWQVFETATQLLFRGRDKIKFGFLTTNIATRNVCKNHKLFLADLIFLPGWPTVKGGPATKMLPSYQLTQLCCYAGPCHKHAYQGYFHVALTVPPTSKSCSSDQLPRNSASHGLVNPMMPDYSTALHIQTAPQNCSESEANYQKNKVLHCSFALYCSSLVWTAKRK